MAWHDESVGQPNHLQFVEQPGLLVVIRPFRSEQDFPGQNATWSQ